MTAPFFDALHEAIERRVKLDWEHVDRARQALSAVDFGAHFGPDAQWRARFELDAVDASLLVVAAAADRDPAAHLLLGLLSGDDGPAPPTVALALELTGVNPSDRQGRSRLTPPAPLVEHRLVQVDGGGSLPGRRLRVPAQVIDQLDGIDRVHPALIGLLVEPVPMKLRGAEQIAIAMAAGERIVWVHEPPGTAGLSIAAYAAGMLNLPVTAVDLRRVPAAGELSADPAREAVRIAIDHAALTGSVLVLSGADVVVPLLRDLLRCAVPIIAVSRIVWDQSWSNYLPIEVVAPRPDHEQRLQLWRALLPELADPSALQGWRLTPEQIAQVARAAVRVAELDGRSVEVDDVRRTARRLDHGRYVAEAEVSIDDLKLPAQTKAEVNRFLAWARHRPEVIARGSLRGAGGKASGLCALFAGGPGTGKTLAAHAIADSLGVELMQVELSSVVSKYVGESEKNLERVFADAESARALLFFDEADALFGSRSAVKDAHDRYANQEIAYLLQRIERFEGVTILATNMRGNLDAAFARRMQFVITFPDPDPETRTALWDAHLAGVDEIDPADPIDTAELGASVELSGGDIRNVVLAAAYDAIAECTPLGHRHIAEALMRELAKLGRYLPGARAH